MSDAARDPAPLTLVVMGVSGVGKTSVAHALVERTGWAFQEGDDLHPDANRAKMAAGTPLTDDDRWPWLRLIAAWIGEQEAAGHGAVVTCSAHKEPVRAATTLYRMAQEIPDTLLIAHIGRSNGAGPTLSALTTVPVITVPASGKEFPEDVWSSLRAPSKVPVMTVLDPANAVLAALNILSARNPRIYAHVRAEIEARTVNTILV